MSWSPIRPAIAFALTSRVVCQAVEDLFASWILGAPIPGTLVPPMILRLLTRVFGGVGLLYPFFLVDLLEVVPRRNPERLQVAKPSGHRSLTEKKTEGAAVTTMQRTHVTTYIYHVRCASVHKLPLTTRPFSK